MSARGWTRIEPLPVGPPTSADPSAELADPVWLLARQWQFGELSGEDAGSPAVVSFSATQLRLTRYRGGLTPGPGQLVEVSRPLAPQVENAPVTRADALFAAKAGLYFLRQLDAAAAPPLSAWRNQLVTDYPVPVTTGASAGLRLLARGAIDGSALYADLDKALRQGLPAATAIPAEAQPVAAAYLAWYDAADAGTPAGDGPGAWAAERLEYGFLLAAPPGEAGAAETVLVAGATSGDLDWSSVDLMPEASLGATVGDLEDAVRTVTWSGIPTRADFHGAPASRFWEFEDAAVNLAAVTGGPEDLVRMLVIDFALRCGNDAFQLPVPVPVGALCRIPRILVADTFGLRTAIAPVAEVDGTDGPFRLFELSVLGGGARSFDLLLFPTAEAPVAGPPFEEVHLLRDENANLCWAVEQTAMNGEGAVVDRGASAAAATAEPPAVVPYDPDVVPLLSYALRSPIPGNWYPLLPFSDEPGAGLGVAQLVDQPTPPWSSLLTELATVVLPTEEVTRAGVRLSRSWQTARTTAGQHLLWNVRRVRPDHPAIGSGLRFDVTSNVRDGA